MKSWCHFSCYLSSPNSFLTPTHASHSNHGRIARMYQSPILMNTLCIGLPVLISLFFITLGVSLSTSHAKLEETYSTFIKQLLHLSEIWKPNDPNTVDNNQHLFDALQRIITGAKKTLHTLQITAIGWAITSMIIIAVCLRWLKIPPLWLEVWCRKFPLFSQSFM